MADNKKHPALDGLSSSIKQEAELEGMRYKNDAALRSPHEDDADLFDDIGNSVSAPGQRPRGLGANLAAGISKGLAYGSRSSATSEKKEKLGKHENVMKYLRESQAAITEQNKYYADQEKKLETVKPFAVGGLEVAYSGMDYNTGSERMRNIIEQAKLADPSIKGDYIGYVPNSPIVNLRNEKGDIIAYSLSNLVGEDVVKRVQENYVKQQQLHTSQDAVEVKKFKEGIPGGSYGIKSDNSLQGEPETLDVDGTQYRVGNLAQLEKSARAHYQKKVNDSLDSIPKNNEALKAIETMEKVFARNPNIGSSLINMLDNPDGVDSWWNLIGRKLSGQDLDDMQILKKATNDLNLDTILGITGKAATDLLKKAVQAASPSGKLSSVAFAHNAKTWREKAMTSNRLITAKYDAMLRGKSISENPRGSSNKVAGSEGGSPLAAFGRKVN